MGETEARGWLLLKIAECMGEEPSDRMADRLATYNGAYQAICQWEGQRPRTSNLQSNKSFTLDDAEDWTSRMVNADGTKGPHWTLEQVKQIMAQRNIPGDPAQFWAAINMIYSDYCKAIQKTSANTLDFYVSITRAFLDDEDANPDKLKLYYDHIVKH